MDERERVRIGTFNLFNLVSPDVRFYGGLVYEPALYQQKVDWIARQLDDMRPDIIGFQEVWHQEALATALKRSDATHQHQIVMEGETGHHPEVALATRYPVLEHERIENFTQAMMLKLDDEVVVPCERFTHAVLKVRLEMRPGLPVTVFVAHLKSKRPKFLRGEDRSDPVCQAQARARSLVLRATEAIALRQLLLREMEGNEDAVIVLGDLNDTEVSVTSTIVSGDAPPRDWSHADKRRVWDTLLYNTKTIQARQSYRDVYYTHIYNGQYESLDHILVSQEFYRQNREAPGYVEYVTVLNDHLLDETTASERVPLWRSDHGQVVATICLRPES